MNKNGFAFKLYQEFLTPYVKYTYKFLDSNKEQFEKFYNNLFFGIYNGDTLVLTDDKTLLARIIDYEKQSGNIVMLPINFKYTQKAVKNLNLTNALLMQSEREGNVVPSNLFVLSEKEDELYNIANIFVENHCLRYDICPEDALFEDGESEPERVKAFRCLIALNDKQVKLASGGIFENLQEIASFKEIIDYCVERFYLGEEETN